MGAGPAVAADGTGTTWRHYDARRRLYLDRRNATTLVVEIHPRSQIQHAALASASISTGRLLQTRGFSAA